MGRLETAASKDRTAADEKVAELTALRAEMEATLQAMAAEALRSDQESFLQLTERKRAGVAS